MLAPRGRDDFDVLSGSGAIIWELLAETATEQEVIDALTEIYEVAPGQIAADVRELLGRLERNGMIESAARMAGLARG